MIGDVDPRVLLGSGPYGLALIALFGASLVFAVIAAALAFFEPGPRRSRGIPVAWGLSAGSGALGLGVSIWLCRRSGGAILGAMGSREFTDEWISAIEMMESTYLTVGLWLFVVASLAAIATFARVFRDRRETARSSRALPLSGALVFLLAAAAVLWRAHLARNPYRGASLAVWEVVWLIEQSLALLPRAKVAVVGAALLGSVAVVLSRARRSGAPPASKRAWIAAGILGVAGLSSWIASRPLAHDGEHPLSFPRGAFAHYHCPTLLRSDPEALPRVEPGGRRCMDLFSEDAIPLALLELGGAGPTADGRPLQGPPSAFEHVNSMRLLRDAGNPPGRWSVILIAAPAEMPAEELGPWLAAIENANQRFAVVLLHDQPPVVTATAGTVARQARCSCPRIAIDPRGTSLAGKRWADVASAAAAAPEGTPFAVDPGYFLKFEGARFTIVKGPRPAAESLDP